MGKKESEILAASIYCSHSPHNNMIDHSKWSLNISFLFRNYSYHLDYEPDFYIKSVNLRALFLSCGTKQQKKEGNLYINFNETSFTSQKVTEDDALNLF